MAHKHTFKVDLLRASQASNLSERFLLQQLNEHAQHLVDQSSTPKGMLPLYRSLFRQYWLALRIKRGQTRPPNFIFT